MPYSVPSVEYVMPPVVVAPPPPSGACAQFPGSLPACPGGKLVWTDKKTVCCK
jgi:hypothetical protein